MKPPKRPVSSFMRKDRARWFSRRSRAKFIEWDVSVIAVRGTRAVRIELAHPDSKKPFTLILEPDDAYELREDLGYAYDQANGI